MTTLLKDLIEIPEQVQKGDFVLRLTEGVIRADETLRDYFVAPELQSCFDNALSFIRSALQSNTSKATYLHGMLKVCYGYGAFMLGAPFAMKNGKRMGKKFMNYSYGH